MKLILAAAFATLLAGGGAQAQTTGSAMGDESVPSCSRTVTDHCIQRGEAMRAAPAMHHRAGTGHRRTAMNSHGHHAHHHGTVKHAMVKKHVRHAAKTAPHAMAPVKPKG